MEKEANFFTSLLNKAALSVRLISNMFRFSAFFAVLSFYFQFFAPLSMVGRTVPETEKRKKEKNEISLKKKGDKKNPL